MPVSPLVVEDGTGLPEADAYVSVTNADRYFEDRGVSAWAAFTADTKIVAIRRATDFIEEQYRDEFAGVRATLGQALSFPRDTTGAVLPVSLVRATLELALLAAEGDLYVRDNATIGAERVVVEERKKIGPLEKTLRYADAPSSVDMTGPTIAVSRVDALLKPLLVVATGFIRVLRA